MSSPSATGAAQNGSLARPNFERVALLLQGGGALGAYQAGVYQALAEVRSSPRLGRRHLDRRHQLGPDRRQPAGAAGRAPAHLLGDRDRTAARRPLSAVGHHRQRHAAPDDQPVPRHGHHAVGCVELLQAAHTAADLPAGRQPREPRLLRHLAVEGAARAFGGFRPDQFGREPLQRRRHQYQDRQLHLLRQQDAQDRPAARHGQRLAAAGLPRHRGRRRVLLGRRRRLQHAAAMDVRCLAARGHAGLPDRPVERTRRAAARHDRNRRADRRTSAIPAAPAPAPTSSAGCRRCGAPPPSSSSR